MILLSAHFLLSLHLWSFRLPESALQIINPLLKQFRSLMIPPSVHYYPNIHSLFSRIHSDLSLTQSLTDLIPSHTIHIDHPTTATLQQGHG